MLGEIFERIFAVHGEVAGNSSSAESNGNGKTARVDEFNTVWGRCGRKLVTVNDSRIVIIFVLQQ